MDSERTSVSVDKETARKISDLAAELQKKRRKFVSQGEAVAVAVEKCLAEVA